MTEQMGFSETKRSQTWEELIAQTLANSGYRAEGDAFVSPEGVQFYPERITDKEDLRINDFFQKSVLAYGEEEATDTSWLQASLAPGRPDRLFYGKTQDGMMGPIIHAEFLPVGANKIAVYSCYTLPDNDSPETLALQSHVFAEAAKEAGGKELVVVTEASGDMEPQCNKGGLRRLYKRGKDGQLEEINAYAPEESFNSRTGEPKFERVAQHLMYWNGGETATTSEILAIAAEMYDQFVKYDQFDTDEAKAKAATGVKGLLNWFKKELGEKELVMFSREQREKIVAEGVAVVNWKEGD
jgi:hypothetical protein